MAHRNDGKLSSAERGPSRVLRDLLAFQPTVSKVQEEVSRNAPNFQNSHRRPFPDQSAQLLTAPTAVSAPPPIVGPASSTSSSITGGKNQSGKVIRLGRNTRLRLGPRPKKRAKKPKAIGYPTYDDDSTGRDTPDDDTTEDETTDEENAGIGSAGASNNNPRMLYFNSAENTMAPNSQISSRETNVAQNLHLSNSTDKLPKGYTPSNKYASRAKPTLQLNGSPIEPPVRANTGAALFGRARRSTPSMGTSSTGGPLQREKRWDSFQEIPESSSSTATIPKFPPRVNDTQRFGGPFSAAVTPNMRAAGMTTFFSRHEDLSRFLSRHHATIEAEGSSSASAGIVPTTFPTNAEVSSKTPEIISRKNTTTPDRTTAAAYSPFETPMRNTRPIFDPDVFNEVIFSDHFTFSSSSRGPQLRSSERERRARRLGVPVSRDIDLPVPELKTAECTGCNDMFASGDVVKATCEHSYCRDCVPRMFAISLGDISLFPQTCCQQELEITAFARFLAPEILQKYNDRKAELRLVTERYCSNKDCALLLELPAVNTHATCSHCKTVTCLLCKGKYHPGENCEDYQETVEVLALAEESKWRQCFRCKAVVGKEGGCNHITCTCRAQFCYLCGSEWRSCDCPMFGTRDNPDLGVEGEADDEFDWGPFIEGYLAGMLRRSAGEITNFDDYEHDARNGISVQYSLMHPFPERAQMIGLGFEAIIRSVEGLNNLMDGAFRAEIDAAINQLFENQAQLEQRYQRLVDDLGYVPV